MTIQLPDIAAKLRIDDSALAAVQGKFASFGQNLQSFGQGATKALTLPFIGFGALAVKEAGEAAKATGQTEAVIKSTGGAAGVTTKQILSLSDSLGKVAGVEGEVVQEGANMLLTFTNVKNEAGKGNDVFNQATKTLLDMSTAMGTEPKQAAIQLGKALNDPIKGITALSRVGVTFTDQQKAQIKALVEAGDTMGAQKIILAELNREFGGSAKAAGDNLGPLERLKLAGADLAESFGTIILPMVQKLATVFVSLAEKFQNLSPEAQKMIVTVGAIAAAVGPVLIVAGKLVQSFSLVSGAFKAMSAVFAANPFLLIAAAAIAIVILIVKNWDTIKAKTIEIWNAIKSFLDGIWNGIKGTASGIWDGIKNFFSGTWNAIKATGEAIWNGIKNSLTAIFNGIKTAVTTIFEGIKSFLTGTWNGIKAGVTSAWDFIKEKITGSINSIRTAVSRVADAIGDFFRDMWEKAKDYVSRIIKKIKELPFVPGSPIPMVIWAGQTRKGVAKQFDGMARDFANFSLPTADSLAPITAPIAVGAPAFAGAGASGVTIENFNVTSQRPDDLAGPVASELGWLLAGVSRGRR